MKANVVPSGLKSLSLESNTINTNRFVKQNQETSNFLNYRISFNFVENLKIKYGFQNKFLSSYFEKGILEDDPDRVLFVLQHKKRDSVDEIKE